ncbi:putative Ig domain-containing protein [Rhizobium leguminosarum]|uniref:putative Ig domain-containing protein n=1 Tax=Rhizobium leguminosarum TaxID=384 RepID=UPI001032265C|nr:putative Ig domain-containing protein [Rhizobium leguminosarum]TAV90455.1 hypothetical protein ELI22_15025 [Rhizobium leguminosarum]TAV95060.1 hypothetical protein ELI21_15180 [Rhizobium leguminosarum]TAW36138.1 hypothetical protein ELI23_15225 [Rhizobium leguminosarum]
MKALLVGLAALLTVAGTATAAPLSPPVPARFDVSYEPSRFEWYVGEAVVLMPAVRFGSGSYQWSVAAGTLPTGLVLGPLGSVYGALRTPGRYAWTVLVRDVETGASATATASVAVQ